MNTKTPFAPKSLGLGLAIASAVATLASPTFAQQEEQTSQEPVQNIYVWGRSTQMLGQADSGSHGIVGNADFSTRPLMRVGELVEVVPGMVATQHSGPGKANQYFLRGMNLDHGSDFTAIFEGMPMNFRSHAHASGYLDMNFLIPELVETVEFHKGTYYAQNGDFSAAGSARFTTYDRVDQGYIEGTVGNFDHRRILAVNSVDMAEGSLIYAGEVLLRDGPWDLAQDQEKVNIFAKYTGNIFGLDGQVSLTGYDSEWNSTDQIPLREVQNGNLGLFGFVDPTLGGESSRYNVIGNFATSDTTAMNVYYSKYSLNLFGNPTYFLSDPVNGDQIEQEDQRSIWGGSYTFSDDYLWGARTVTPALGIEFRHDDISDVNLFNTLNRQRIGTVRDDAVEETSYSLYGEAEILWSDNFRTTFGLRGEFYSWDVDAQIAANSGSGNESMVMPKFTAAWIPSEGYEVYFNYGEGFHSNDVRGAEITLDPVTLDPVDPVDVLVRAEGAELGLRVEPTDNFNASIVAFWMELDSELLFVGDAGTSEPNDPTKRHGIELATFWEINDYLVFDATATWNKARFINVPSEANHVPDAHETTASAGLTLIHPSGFTGSLRMRHFGDAPLDEGDTVQKEGTTLFNLGLAYPINEQLEIGLDILNLFDDDGNDIEFFFESQLATEVAPVEDFHFHPVESRAYRLMVKYNF